MSWPMVNLHDVCRPKQWKTISTGSLKEAGFPVYGANGKIGFYDEYTHKKPTLMITCRGATCGNVHISEPFAYINGNAMALDDLNTEKVDIKFLYYYFLRRGFNDVISGSAQPQITGQGLTKVQIPLPPLAEQKRIAAILDKADAIRRKRQQAIQLADDFLRAVFLEMFGDISNFKVMKIHEVAADKKYSLSSGPFGSSLTSQHYIDEGVLVLRGVNVSSGELNLQNVKYVSKAKALELKRSAIVPGDVVIVAVGASGHAFKIPADIPEAIMSQNFNKITPDTNKVTSTYLEHCFNSVFVQNQFAQNTTDTVRTFLSLTKIKEVEIPVPPLTLQLEFEHKFLRALKRRAKICESASLADNFYASLSQKAFSGRL